MAASDRHRLQPWRVGGFRSGWELHIFASHERGNVFLASLSPSRQKASHVRHMFASPGRHPLVMHNDTPRHIFANGYPGWS
jgi:hypothetical protein